MNQQHNTVSTQRRWSILLTSANHGTVGPLGSTFAHAGEKHERVDVIEVVANGAAPAPGNVPTGASNPGDLAARAFSAARNWANSEYTCARDLGKGGAGIHAQCDAAERECRAAIEALAAASAISHSGEGEKHLPGWERGVATVTLDGHQLRAALEFINPDGEGDPDQLDDWLTFGVVQHKDDNGEAATGLCCWNDDSDGVLPLDIVCVAEKGGAA